MIMTKTLIQTSWNWRNLLLCQVTLRWVSIWTCRVISRDAKPGYDGWIAAGAIWTVNVLQTSWETQCSTKIIKWCKMNISWMLLISIERSAGKCSTHYWWSWLKVWMYVTSRKVFSQAKMMSTATQTTLTSGLDLDMSRSCWNLNDAADTERLWKYLRAERSVHFVGFSTCKVFMEMQCLDHRNPMFKRSLGMSHLKSLLATCSWQGAQERLFLHLTPPHNWSRDIKTMEVLLKVLRVRVTTTKQFVAFMQYNRWLAARSVEVREESAIRFALSVLQALRRAVEEITGAASTGLSLDP